VTRFIPVLPCCVLIAVLTPWCASSGSSGVEVSDLWDTPLTLGEVCNGAETLVFVCDLDLKQCREGAVYFDTRAEAIKARGFTPCCLFVGQPQEVRRHVLSLDLGIPAYIDSDGGIFKDVLDQRIMPALMLLDGNGNLVRTVYGGGESLDHNLALMLEPEPAIEPGSQPSGRGWLWILLPAAVVAAVVLIALG
jgi:hypothetical protein